MPTENPDLIRRDERGLFVIEDDTREIVGHLGEVIEKGTTRANSEGRLNFEQALKVFSLQSLIAKFLNR